MRGVREIHSEDGEEGKGHCIGIVSWQVEH